MVDLFLTARNKHEAHVHDEICFLFVCDWDLVVDGGGGLMNDEW